MERGSAGVKVKIGRRDGVSESLHSLHEFRRYVEAGETQVVQIDAITNGGITAAREALRLANSARLPTSSHYNDELSAHMLCPSSDPLDLEKHAFALDRYLEEPRAVDDGSVRPTESPGTDVRFRDASLAPHRVA